MNADAGLVIQDLLNQIANLSKEKAVYYALVMKKDQEIQNLRQELDQRNNTN
jgi:hypothetical protein